MKPANIAIVWAPNLLRDAPGDEHMALVNIPKTHRCIQSLVENYDEIFHAHRSERVKAESQKRSSTSISTTSPHPDSNKTGSEVMEAKLALQQQSIDLLKARLQAMQDKEAKWVEQRTRLETQLTHAIKWSMPNGPDSEDESKPSVKSAATATKSPRYKIMKEIRSRNGSTVPVGATNLTRKSIDSTRSSDVPAPPNEKETSGPPRKHPPSTGVQVMVAERKLKSNLKSILKKRSVQNPQVIEVSSENNEENVRGGEAIKVDEEELETEDKTSSIETIKS
eukprot:CAMPEP_0185281720 /NCGR_PEP_ID=MMETSP1359-20130426/66875_1 /TAXON_ID=552665 /ORGANISM="Bigelowiella longifila, Strain CCMP242" /LENGTH=279 /DNA_ID=CAMNT_0027877183 /DNA_START=492 /DNA_END=1331 /DNA_ORIENTATION=-